MAVTLREIADRTGVSVAAVSMALRDHPRIGADRRRTIQKVARELGYQPDVMASVMRSQRSHTIGLLLSNLRVTSTNYRSDAIEEALSNQGYHVQVAFTQSEPQRVIDQVRRMRASRVEGLVVQGNLPPESRAAIDQELRLCQFPVVLSDCWTEVTAESGMHIGIDRRGATRRLAERLIAGGRRNLLFVGVELHGNNGEKFQGVREACQAAGVRLHCADLSQPGRWLTPEQALAAAGQPVPGLYHAGRSVTRSLHVLVQRVVRQLALAPKCPDAVLASNDELALIVMQGLGAAGRLQEVAITGYDDIATARWMTPALTTVREPRKRMARHVTTSMLSMLAGQSPPQNRVMLAPSVVWRHSTPERK